MRTKPVDQDLKAPTVLTTLAAAPPVMLITYRCRRTRTWTVHTTLVLPGAYSRITAPSSLANPVFYSTLRLPGMSSMKSINLADLRSNQQSAFS